MSKYYQIFIHKITPDNHYIWMVKNKDHMIVFKDDDEVDFYDRLKKLAFNLYEKAKQEDPKITHVEIKSFKDYYLDQLLKDGHKVVIGHPYIDDDNMPQVYMTDCNNNPVLLRKDPDTGETYKIYDIVIKNPFEDELS